MIAKIAGIVKHCQNFHLDRFSILAIFGNHGKSGNFFSHQLLIFFSGVRKDSGRRSRIWLGRRS
jgi:hypothetical protein